MSFFGNMFGVKVAQASTALTNLVVAYDPDTASEAQTRMVADELSKTNGRVAELQATLEIAQRTVKEDEDGISYRMTAIKSLFEAGKKEKAAGLMQEVQDLKEKLDNDQKVLADTTEHRDAMSGRAHELAEKLRINKQRTDKAKMAMSRADMDLQRAKEAANDAMVDAGLKRSVSNLDVATQAMEDVAKRKQQEAEKYRLNAASIKGAFGGGEVDSDVKAAMDAAQGKSKPAMSLDEQFAALQAQVGKAA